MGTGINIIFPMVFEGARQLLLEYLIIVVKHSNMDASQLLAP